MVFAGRYPVRMPANRGRGRDAPTTAVSQAPQADTRVPASQMRGQVFIFARNAWCVDQNQKSIADMPGNPKTNPSTSNMSESLTTNPQVALSQDVEHDTIHEKLLRPVVSFRENPEDWKAFYELELVTEFVRRQECRKVRASFFSWRLGCAALVRRDNISVYGILGCLLHCAGRVTIPRLAAARRSSGRAGAGGARATAVDEVKGSIVPIVMHFFM